MIFTAGHGSAYPVSHVGMFIGRDSSGNSRGLDGGGTDPINESAVAAGRILDGDMDPNKMRWTIQSSDHPEVILRYIGGPGVADPESTDGAVLGSSAQGKIKLSKAMEAASPQWKYYPDKLTKGGYWDAAKKAGYTTAQTAMVAAIGIHENGAKKLTGEESVTKVAWDDIGKQYAFGIMNWIPDAANSRVGADETKYGRTMADQLNFIRKAYLMKGATEERAKIVNFNRYGPAMKEALGYAPKLGQGDYWGPYAETDIAEAMGHFVGNALVPWDYKQTRGQARHMRTAVEAYNWMLENGVANGYATGSQSGGGSGSIGAGFDIAAMMGESANNLPDYYKNMLGLVQNSINTTAAAASSYDSSSSFGDYGEYDDYDEGEAEGLS
jgi:hypothetical protein